MGRRCTMVIALTVVFLMSLLYETRLRGHVVPADWTAEAHTANAEFGTEVAAGDYNGDGYTDVLVGAYTYTNGEEQEGASYIFFGTASGPSTQAGWVWESNVEGLHSGRSVANVGDLNGDGIDDILIGAPTNSNDPADGTTAAVYLFLGSPTGPRLVPDWEHFSHLYGDRFGRTVDTAGDVNGDGYDDLLIGAYYWDGGEVNEGAVWVIHGSSTGIPPATECASCHERGSMWRAESNQAEAGMGWGAATAGDVNGDGYDDVVAGAPNFVLGHDPTNPQSSPTMGAAFVYLGSATGLSRTPQAVLPSPDNGSQFGRTVSSAGDVNGDGYSDIIVGARRYDRDSRRLKEGAAVVYHGSPSGIVPEPAWTAAGTVAEGFFGHAVSSAGDINGDGYSDVLVGEQLAVFAETGTAPPAETSDRVGRVHVYLGSAAGLSPTPAWSLDGDRLHGDFGVWVEPAGDMDDDGRGDILIGAWRYDNDQENEGRVFLYYGSTLRELGLREPRRAAAHDYNGDGRTDLLWGYTTGHLAVTVTNTVDTSRTELLRVDGAPWRFAATGDFNGDGKAEVIQQNVIDGQARMSFLDANIVVMTSAIRGMNHSTWRVMGSGDFDGDNRDDVLWYDPASKVFHITLMDGVQVLSSGQLSGVSDPDGLLTVGGVGDFNGDSIDDIVWSDTGSGDVVLTLLSGFAIVDHRRLYNSTELAWRIAGVGDFNADTKADVVLWDAAKREIHLVTMDGSRAGGVTMIGQVPESWEPGGVGFFDGDRMPDVLWRHQTSGEIVAWLMDGVRIRESTAIGSGPGLPWKFLSTAQS